MSTRWLCLWLCCALPAAGENTPPAAPAPSAFDSALRETTAPFTLPSDWKFQLDGPARASKPAIRQLNGSDLEAGGPSEADEDPLFDAPGSPDSSDASVLTAPESGLSNEVILKDGEAIEPDAAALNAVKLMPEVSFFNPYLGYGKTQLNSLALLPVEPVHGVAGDLQITEWDTAGRGMRAQFGDSVTFAATSAFKIHFWDGPAGVALGGAFFHIGWDFELLKKTSGPWSGELGFTPQIVSDFRRGLNSGGYNFDGRAVVYYRSSPELQFAVGAAYWNRVQNRVIPLAGFVWTPNECWDVQLLFPRSRISYRLRSKESEKFGPSSTWIYASGEYNIEAFQANIDDTRYKDRMEMADNRFLLGLNSQGAFCATFFEGGWVFDRHVRFTGPTPGFNIVTGPLLRAGFRY